MSFHDVRFPTDISRGATGGPERRTDVVVLGSGHEERNARWADSRRAFNAGYGVKTLDQIHAVVAFFEERRGRLYGFRWKDHTDWRSGVPSVTPGALDQTLGLGDGATATFQLRKRYGEAFAPWYRDIAKPVTGSVLVAVAGEIVASGTHYTIDHSSGRITFLAGHFPAAGAAVTAGFDFDVPVRFDTDKLEINLAGFRHGAVPSIPIVEIRL